jgi:hypothetical protein
MRQHCLADRRAWEGDLAERHRRPVSGQSGCGNHRLRHPVLSMHAPFEAVSSGDVYMTYQGFTAFFEKFIGKTLLLRQGTGAYAPVRFFTVIRSQKFHFPFCNEGHSFLRNCPPYR